MNYSNQPFNEHEKKMNFRTNPTVYEPNAAIDNEGGNVNNNIDRLKLMKSLQPSGSDQGSLYPNVAYGFSGQDNTAGFGNNIPMGGLGKRTQKSNGNLSGFSSQSQMNQIRKPQYPESMDTKPVIEKTPTYIYKPQQNDFNEVAQKQLKGNHEFQYNHQYDNNTHEFSSNDEYSEESNDQDGYKMSEYEMDMLNKRLAFEHAQKMKDYQNQSQMSNQQQAFAYQNETNPNSYNRTQMANQNQNFAPNSNAATIQEQHGYPNLQSPVHNQNYEQNYYNQPLSKPIQPNIGYINQYQPIGAKLETNSPSSFPQDQNRPRNGSYYSNNSPSHAMRYQKESERVPQNNENGKLGVANILIVGCGGGGNNTIHRLKTMGIQGAKCIAINTDKQHLDTIKSDQYILIGKNLTRGLGAGGQPEIGQAAAEETREEINAHLKNADLVFITCGMGGGTGTGSAPVVAEIAKKNDAIVVGVVTIPFKGEKGRMEKATIGIKNLRQFADTLIIIDNNKLLDIASNLPINEAFSLADEVLATMVKGITEVISYRSLINLDYNDVKTTLRAGGVAIVGIGESKEGDQDRVQSAIQDALNSPLLEFDIKGAKSALIHVSGGKDLSLQEAYKVAEVLTKEMAPNAMVIWGTRTEPELTGILRVMLIITGVKSPQIMGSTNKYLNTSGPNNGSMNMQKKPKTTLSSDLFNIKEIKTLKD